ncbi:MAG: hypothetical protein AB2421_02600 [Thermotaleaceae bacterium]
MGQVNSHTERFRRRYNPAARFYHIMKKPMEAMMGKTAQNVYKAGFSKKEYQICIMKL